MKNVRARPHITVGVFMLPAVYYYSYYTFFILIIHTCYNIIYYNHIVYYYNSIITSVSVIINSETYYYNIQWFNGFPEFEINKLSKTLVIAMPKNLKQLITVLYV